MEGLNKEQHGLICVFQRSSWLDVGDCKMGENSRARATSEEAVEISQLRGSTRVKERRESKANTSTEKN